MKSPIFLSFLPVAPWVQGIDSDISESGLSVNCELAVKRISRLQSQLTQNCQLLESVQQAIDGAVARFGAIHAVVNCAGVGSAMKVIGKNSAMPLEKFNQTIQINLVGTMNIVRLAAEKMLQNTPMDDGEKGGVINTASVAAFDGQVGQAAYAASKAGIVGMTLPSTMFLWQSGWTNSIMMT